MTFAMLYYLIFYVVPVLATLRIMNFLRVSNRALETEYHLKHLHSKLMLLAIENKDYREDSRFKFLEFSLRNSRAILKNLNFWVILYRTFEARHEHENTDTFFSFEKDMAHDKNIKEIYNDFTKTLMNFFRSKSKFSLVIFEYGLKAIKFCIGLVEGEQRDKSVEYKRKIKYFVVYKQGPFAGSISPYPNCGI